MKTTIGAQKIFTVLFVLVLALGVFFRVYDLGGRDLWTDEAWVALAAIQPTPALALQEGKSTPPLYLLTVWGAVQVLGRSEAALRLTSCLLGLGALLVIWFLARALLPPWSALAVFALASISPRLVYFSKELKQYSADIFFAALAFWLVERQLQRQGRGGWLLFTLLLALGLGYSHPLVFILPVAALVLWWHLPQARPALYASFGTLGLIFVASYGLFFRGQVDPELLIYWQADFPDLTCGTDFLCWLGAAWSRFGRYFFPDWRALAGGLVILVGLVDLARRGQARVLWYFFGPILGALAAAGAHRYPFMGGAGGVRLMMFCAPMVYVAAGAGIGAVCHWLAGGGDPAVAWKAAPARGQEEKPEAKPRPRRWPLAGWRQVAGVVVGAIVLVGLQPLTFWQENLHPQMNREDIKPLVRSLETQQRPGDLIYVYYFAIYPFKFYFQGPQENIVWGESCHERCLPLPPARLAQVDRVWLIFSHFETAADVDKFINNLLGPGWVRESACSQPGAALFRYRPPWAPAAPRPDPLSPPGPG